ncbi:hypothetical protein KI387_032357, partial [Taxus chinensis]
EALLAFKSAVGDPPTLNSWMGREPCLRSWIGVQCTGKYQNSTVISLKLTGYKLEGVISPAIQDLTSLVTLWLDDNHFRGHIPSGLGNLKKLTSLRLSNNILSGSVPSTLALLPRLKELTLMNNHLRGSLPFDGTFSRVVDILVHGNAELCSRSGSFNLSVCGPSLAPALAFNSPSIHQNDDSGKSESKVGAIVGGAVGCVVLVGIIIAFVYFCLMRAKRFSSRTSETGSSEPSVHVEWVKGRESPLVAGAIPLLEVPQARVFTVAELEHATKQFTQNSLMGRGGFGQVYKGLLHDGTIVAIKTRTSSPSQDFVNEVRYLCHIRHRHLVSLLGYCQENDQQMLVYDYMPNGSVCNHLYDSDGNSLGKLDFRQRLSIALGAAKGLEHLHALTPPLVHKDFKTSNVLVDENYIAKVTDFGLSRLLAGIHGAGSSSPVDDFLDPEFNTSRMLYEKSDVYSFGVFLLELISGREVLSLNSSGSERNLVNWAHSLQESNKLADFIDSTMNHNFTEESVKEFMDVALLCVELLGERRPTMNEVMKELDRILEKERGQTAATAEGAAVVKLGNGQTGILQQKGNDSRKYGKEVSQNRTEGYRDFLGLSPNAGSTPNEEVHARDREVSAPGAWTTRCHVFQRYDLVRDIYNVRRQGHGMADGYGGFYGRFSGLVQKSLALLATISNRDNCVMIIGGSGVDLNTNNNGESDGVWPCPLSVISSFFRAHVDPEKCVMLASAEVDMGQWQLRMQTEYNASRRGIAQENRAWLMQFLAGFIASQAT